MNNNGDDVNSVESDDVGTDATVGRRKKKRGLAVNVKGKSNADSSPSPTPSANTQQHSEPTSNATESVKNAMESTTADSNDKPQVENLSSEKQASEISPIDKQNTARDEPTKTDEETKTDGSQTATETVSALPSNPPKMHSENFPTVSSRSKFSHGNPTSVVPPMSLHGPSKLIGTSAATLTTAPPTSRSSGEPRKSTPRPLPPHLKQAFASSSNSPRNSLNLSAAHSLSEELTKSVTAGPPTLDDNVNKQPVSFLRQISSRDIKRRSYLVGSLGSQLSLGGKPELEYYFPDRHVRIYVGTWNMSAIKDPPKELEQFVLPDYAANDSTAPAPHVLTFGTQESMTDRRKWLIKIQELIGQHYVMLTSAFYGALGLAIFIRRELIWFVSSPIATSSFPRAYQPIATKGTLALSFELFGTSLAFITSHFSAGEGNLEARIDDYKKAIVDLKYNPVANKNDNVKQRINSVMNGGSLANVLFSRRGGSATVPSTPTIEQVPGSLPLSSRRPISADEFTASRDTGTKDYTSQFDAVFWFGDFNFRVTRERHHVDKVIESYHATKNKQTNQVRPLTSEEVDDMLEPLATTNSHEIILEHDEMSKELAHGTIFVGFNEGRIRFMPTYKFDIGTSRYDSSAKSRIQSYTDRIIFRSRRKNAITCLAYSSIEEIVDSDHKPLYGVYDVELRPGLDSLPSGAGCFDREVYLDGLRQRAQILSTDKSSSVCSIQ